MRPGVQIKKPSGCAPEGFLAVSGMFLYDYFLGAAHASLSVAKLWSASEVREVGACQGALPLGCPRFFEKNRVKLFILRTFFRHCNASADSYVSAKLVFRQSGRLPERGRSFCRQGRGRLIQIKRESGNAPCTAQNTPAAPFRFGRGRRGRLI